jgi:hypothetical protein
VRSGTTDAVLLEIGDGVSVRLAPGTTLVVRPMGRLPAEHPGAPSIPSLQVLLTAGELDVTVHEPHHALGVSIFLPNGGSVAIWRGSANVARRGDDTTAALYEGLGIAGAGSGWQPLTPGKGVVLSTTKLATHAIPAKPEWPAGAGADPLVAMVVGNEQGSVDATWTPSPDASEYRVEVAESPTMTGHVRLTSLPGVAPQFHGGGLTASAYSLRVRAVSADGIVGPPSAPRSVRIARVVLPPGAVVAPDGALVLPVGTGLSLDDPRGFETATLGSHDVPDDALFWSPAPTKIGLESGHRARVRVRNKASHMARTFVLAQRALHARVAFQPAHPKWPTNPVDIVVTLDDPAGYTDPASETVTLDARLDLTHLDLPWQHTGATWTARVNPQWTAGPWVIRVDVADSTGAAIGGSLVDVDPIKAVQSP